MSGSTPAASPKEQQSHSFNRTEGFTPPSLWYRSGLISQLCFFDGTSRSARQARPGRTRSTYLLFRRILVRCSHAWFFNFYSASCLPALRQTSMQHFVRAFLWLSIIDVTTFLPCFLLSSHRSCFPDPAWLEFCGAVLQDRALPPRS